ncbi:MAG: hypothetical protein GY852_08650, partial [bacterium]|nr:hypothetical protein [bacterium]
MKIEKIRVDNSGSLDTFLETLKCFSMENGAAEAGILLVGDLEFSGEVKGHDPQEESMYWPRVRYAKDSMQGMLEAFAKAMVFRVDGAGRRTDTLL